ncbi:Rpn family recombination-promoting nuclease/putative transposase [Peptococcus simiae]|uniref:Rpn family recombination-promoting nuclease/putative transposase n=1 Tax=Peptococcus simiae TaxID=1643805 RepID=A0ABW9GZX2_9FIRM
MCEPKFYRLTNDLMFHIVMQENEVALRGLIAAMLSKPADAITSVQVLNPIDFHKKMTGKEIILDVKAEVDAREIVNVEVQVRKFKYWRDRALYYAARMLSGYNPGAEYGAVKPIRQVSILDYPFDSSVPKFFYNYRLIEDDIGEEYSDKFQLSVLNLRRMDLATEVDRLSNRLLWAKLFRAQSWNALEELTENSNLAKEVVETMYEATTDDNMSRWLSDKEILERDRAAQEAYAREENMIKGMEKGMEIKNFEFAKNLLVEGFSRDDVRRLTNYPFSDEELDSLK